MSGIPSLPLNVSVSPRLPRRAPSGCHSGFGAGTILVALVALMAGLALTGCRASPAPESGFLEDWSKMRPDPDIPFNRGYWNPQVDQAAYTEIYVAPVNTKYVMAQNIWERTNEVEVSEGDFRKSVDAMAPYMQEAFRKAAAEDPHRRFVVVDKPGPKTIILEMAIVQLVPAKVLMNAVGLVSWIPTALTAVGSTVASSEDKSKGIIAIEARLRDGATGEVVGMFADRQRPPTAVLDFRSLNSWAPCKSIIDNWAKQFIEVANNPGKKVPDAKEFELLVW